MTIRERENGKQMVVRLSAALLAEVDAFACAQRRATGLRVMRSDAVRLLLARGLSIASPPGGRTESETEHRSPGGRS